MKTKVIIIVPVAILAVITGIMIYAYTVYFLPDKPQDTRPAAIEATTPRQTKQAEVPTSTPEPTKEVRQLKMVAVGDILLGRGVGTRLEKQKKGYIYPFEQVAGILKQGDIVFGNLEEPITDRTHCLRGIHEGGKYVLKNNVQAFQGIQYAGFNLLNLANNHILDYYDQGLYDTMEILDQNGIAYAGAGKNLDEARKLAIVEKQGVKVGMLSYTDMSEVVYAGNPPLSFIAGADKAGVAPTKKEYIFEDVGKAKDQVDLLIVSLHWGKEESFDVLPGQVELAHQLLDQGVDIILGHHPHQFQGIEIYKGKPIVYSLGNFIFDQNDPENQEAFILEMEFEDENLVDFTGVPVRTINKTQVVPQKGKDAEGMLKRQVELSKALGAKCSIKDGKIVFEVQ